MENESLPEVLRQLAELQKKIDDLAVRVSALEKKEADRPRRCGKGPGMVRIELPGPRG
jgi:chaperonin cofactor prefoldin